MDHTNKRNSEGPCTPDFQGECPPARLLRFEALCCASVGLLCGWRGSCALSNVSMRWNSTRLSVVVASSRVSTYYNHLQSSRRFAALPRNNTKKEEIGTIQFTVNMNQRIEALITAKQFKKEVCTLFDEITQHSGHEQNDRLLKHSFYQQGQHAGSQPACTRRAGKQQENTMQAGKIVRIRCYFVLVRVHCMRFG